MERVCDSGGRIDAGRITPVKLDRLPVMGRPRVLLADDHALLLGAFEKLLAADCDIVGQVSDGRALVAAADELKPDIVVLDISMPLLNGLEAARQIRQKTRSVKFVFVTMNEDAELAAEAFRSGASAYLLKRSAASELLTAIRQVMDGRSYVTPLITEGARRLAPARRRGRPEPRTDAAAARSAAAAGRRTLDEGSRPASSTSRRARWRSTSTA